MGYAVDEYNRHACDFIVGERSHLNYNLLQLSLFLGLFAGQCQFCEPTGLASPADIFHVNTVGQLVMTFDVSSSKRALVFGDSGGCVHLWADSPEATFNAYSRETEFPMPCMVDTLPHLDWNDDLLPLSLIPVPLITESLLSDWPTANCVVTPR